MTKYKNTYMELADLEAMLLYICNTLNRPIRKSMLIRMVTELFECSTVKQINFALIGLIEQGHLCQEKHFIITPDFASEWNGNVTASDEGIIKFILSLKEEAKHDLFFNVFAGEPLTPQIFFKYIQMKYPALLHRKDTALTYMEFFTETLPNVFSDSFYAEMNDSFTNRWFTKFFNNQDCRIIIKDIDIQRNHVNILLTLLPAKGYKKANADFDEFAQNITSYFNSNMIIHVKKSMAAFSNGRKRKRK